MPWRSPDEGMWSGKACSVNHMRIDVILGLSIPSIDHDDTRANRLYPCFVRYTCAHDTTKELPGSGETCRRQCGVLHKQPRTTTSSPPEAPAPTVCVSEDGVIAFCRVANLQSDLGASAASLDDSLPTVVSKLSPSPSSQTCFVIRITGAKHL
jgi:hypothetical protein